MDQLAPSQAARNVFGMLKTSSPEVEPELRGPPLANVGAAAAIQPGLRSDEVQKLRAALDELSECRRMVDAALRSDAA
jgi:hypothetical protein